MNHQSFDILTRDMAGLGSRRTMLRGLGSLGLGVARFPGIAAAKQRKRKDKKRDKQPNAFGCLEVGDPCKSEEQCCSGICEGKKGRRTCRAHDTGTCEQGFPGLCSDPPTFASCNDSETCFCLRTTANSNFCAQLGAAVCTDCRKDADCEALGLPPGSACLPTTGIYCAGQCPETGMACLPPCGAEIPEK